MKEPAFVFLGAGRSSRMGRSKGLLDCDGRSWLEVQVEAVEKQGLRRVVLVQEEEAYGSVLSRLPGVEARSNPQPERGPFSSLQIGLRDLDGPAWVCPLDVPVAAGFRELEPHLGADAEAVVPTWQGRGGHPVLLGPGLIQRLLALDPVEPEARLDVQLRRARALRIPLADPNVTRNLNTPEDWAAFRAQP